MDPHDTSNNEIVIGFETRDGESTAIASYCPDMAAIIDQRNKWMETGELGEELEHEMYRRGSRLLYDIMLFITNGIAFDSRRGIFRAALRTLCVIWVLAPDLLRRKDGGVVSLDDMAKPMSVSRCWVSVVAEEFSDCFGYFGRNQKKLTARPNYAAATKNAWANRKAQATEKKAAKKAIPSTDSK